MRNVVEVLDLFNRHNMEVTYAMAVKLASHALQDALIDNGVYITIGLERSVKTGKIFIDHICWGDMLITTSCNIEGGSETCYVVNIDTSLDKDHAVSIEDWTEDEHKVRYFKHEEGVERAFRLLDLVNLRSVAQWDKASL